MLERIVRSLLGHFNFVDSTMHNLIVEENQRTINRMSREIDLLEARDKGKDEIIKFLTDERTIFMSKLGLVLNPSNNSTGSKVMQPVRRVIGWAGQKDQLEKRSIIKKSEIDNEAERLTKSKIESEIAEGKM